MTEQLILKGTLEGHSGWVTSLATSLENPNSMSCLKTPQFRQPLHSRLLHPQLLQPLRIRPLRIQPRTSTNLHSPHLGIKRQVDNRLEPG